MRRRRPDRVPPGVRRVTAVAGALLMVLAACRAPSPGPDRVFVRGAIVSRSDGDRALPDGRFLTERAWRPGDAVDGAVAPEVAECVTVFRHPLGDVSRLVALGGEAPDTALAFSPDGALLAVGSYLGDVLVLDGWSGALLARRHLAETMVKAVAWSPDGQTLYAAEQSPDAFVHALAADTLASRWRVRLADRVGTSAPPPAGDLYGVYTLPAAYGLTVLPDGSLLVAAVHAWNPSEGGRANLSQLLVVRPDGTVRATWPDEPASVTLLHPRVDPRGRLVAVPVGRSASGPAPDLPVGAVQILALPELTAVGTAFIAPLTPWYTDVFVWEALAVADDRVLVGTGDGRAVLFDSDGSPLARRDVTTPIDVGGVPVGAPIGHAALLSGGVTAVLTADSSIPFGAGDPALRPPAPHPGANALVVGVALAGGAVWSGPWVLAGLTPGPDGRTLVVGAGPRRTDDRRDLFGALVLDVPPDDPSATRLVAFCGTESPVFFRQAVTADGRIAVAEHPFRAPDGGVVGDHRVTVLR